MLLLHSEFLALDKTSITHQRVGQLRQLLPRELLHVVQPKRLSGQLSRVQMLRFQQGLRWVAVKDNGAVWFGWAFPPESPTNDHFFEFPSDNTSNSGFAENIDKLAMAEFNRDTDEVLDVVSYERPWGNVQDIVVVVMRHSLEGKSPQLRLYRAAVAYRSCWPGRAEAEPAGDPDWKPMGLLDDQLPDWMLKSRIRTYPTANVLLKSFKNKWQRLKSGVLALEMPPAVVLYVGGKTVVIDAGQNVYVCSVYAKSRIDQSAGEPDQVDRGGSHTGSTPIYENMNSSGSGGATRSTPDVTRVGNLPHGAIDAVAWMHDNEIRGENEIRLIVATNAPSLSGVEISRGRLTILWAHSLSYEPQAIARVPSAAGQDIEPWPDIVLGNRDEWLSWFRYVGKREIYKAWQTCIPRWIDPNSRCWDLKSAIKKVNPGEIRSDEVRPVALALVHCAAKDRSASQKVIQTLVELLSKVPFSREWRPLGQDIGRYIDSVWNPEKNKIGATSILTMEEWEHQATVILELYQGLGFIFRKEIDVCIRQLIEHLPAQKPTALVQLIERSQESLWSPDIAKKEPVRLAVAMHQTPFALEGRFPLPQGGHQGLCALDGHTIMAAGPIHSGVIDIDRHPMVTGIPGQPGAKAGADLCAETAEESEAQNTTRLDISGARMCGHVKIGTSWRIGYSLPTGKIVWVSADYPRNQRDSCDGPKVGQPGQSQDTKDWEYRGRAGSVCVAAIAQPDDSASNRTVMALLWSTRSWSALEWVELRIGDDGKPQWSRLSLCDLEAGPTTAAALQWQAPGIVRVAAATYGASVIHVVDVEVKSDTPRKVCSAVQVESDVTALRFDLTNPDRLIIGTRQGLVWCRTICGAGEQALGSAHVDWVFRSKTQVVGLDQEPSTDNENTSTGRILVSSLRDHLILLDIRGKRLWREKVGDALKGGIFLVHNPIDGKSPTIPYRIAAWTEDGKLHIYRETVPKPPLEAVSVEEQLPAEEYESYQALLWAHKKHYLTQPLAFVNRRARYYALEHTASDPELSKERLLALARTSSFRELALILRSLPTTAGTDIHRDLYKILVHRVDTLEDDNEHGDDSKNSQHSAFSEFFHRVAHLDASLPFFKSYIEDLPEQVAKDTWVGVQVIRCWLKLLPPQTTSEQPTAADALGVLHLLPPVCGRLLPRLLPDSLEPQKLRAWCDAAHDPAAFRTTAGMSTHDELVELAQRWKKPPINPPSPPSEPRTLPSLWDGLFALVLSTPTDRWKNARTFLRAVRRAKWDQEGDSLFQLPKLLATKLPSDVPHAGWPLTKQLEWLREALSKPLDLGEPSDTTNPWTRLLRLLARQFGRVVRDAILQQLTDLSTLTRVRLDVENECWPISNLVRLDLKLTPEGQQPLSDVEITIHVGPHDGRPGLTACNTDVKQVRKAAFLNNAVGPLLVVVEGVVPSGLTKVPIRVKLTSREQKPYEHMWEYPLQLVRGVSKSDRTKPLTKPLHDRLESLCLGKHSGVVVVTMDDHLHVEDFIERLGGVTATKVVDLDDALAEVGPHRKYPKNFTQGAMLRALNGEKVLERYAERSKDPRARLHTLGMHRIVVAHCRETFTRLHHESVAEVREQVVTFLRLHAEKDLSPALIFLTPTEWAGTVARELGNRCVWLHPERLVPSAADDTLTTAVIEALVKQNFTAHAAKSFIRKAACDLRTVVAAWGASDAESAERMLGERPLQNTIDDLGALNPKTLPALLLCYGSTSQISAKELQDGMVAAETIITHPKGKLSRPKSMATRGVPIDRSKRLVAALPKGSKVVIEGIFPDGTTTVIPPFDVLKAIVSDFGKLKDELLRLGFIQEQVGGFRVVEFYRIVLSRLIRPKTTVPDLVERLARKQDLWEAVSPEQLHLIATEHQDLLFGVASAETHIARRAVGRWFSGALPESDAVMLARWLSGWDGRPSANRSAGTGGAKDLNHWVTLSNPSGTTPKPYSLWLRTDKPTHTPSHTTTPAQSDTPVVVVLGPGFEGYPLMHGVITVTFTLAEWRAVLMNDNPPHAFWAIVRARADHEATSPFVKVGALPVGSPVFVGREDVWKPILKEITQKNFLILGARQIGKTSLLNKIYGEIKFRTDIGAIYIDLQGRSTQLKWDVVIKDALDTVTGPSVPPSDDSTRRLTWWAKGLRAKHKTPVVFLNEIDGVLETDPHVIEQMRGLSEINGIRFVMVGYATVFQHLRSLKSPLYHMTKGEEGRYFNLTTLTQDAAVDLIRKLEVPPVMLVWYSTHERKRGQELLVQRSYRIPWVLQQLCDQLVQRKKTQTSAVLRVDDVSQVLEQYPPLQHYISDIDLAELAGKSMDGLLQRQATFLLHVLAWQKYFATENALLNPHLDEESDAFRGFRPGEVPELLRGVLVQLPLSDQEVQRVQQVFQHFNYACFLGGMCLTILMAPVAQARTEDTMYCFHGHIYPRELYRQAGGESKTVLDLVLDRAGEVLAGLP